jgi:hypothetical protein
VGVGETNASEPLETHRKCKDDIETSVRLIWEQHGSNLLTDHAVSGVEVA